MGWPEPFHISDKKAETIVCIFINNYLPIFMCPYLNLRISYWTMFSNNLALTTSSQPHITHKIMENWRFSTNTLSLLLRNCVKRILTTRAKNIHQVLASYHETLHFATAETPFFLVYVEILISPVTYCLNQCSNSSVILIPGHLDLKVHCLTLGHAKKTLDENRFKHAQKRTDCTQPNF